MCANRFASDCGSANGKHLSGYTLKSSICEDDRIFETALVKVCGFWLLDTLMRHGGLERALRKDFLWFLPCASLLAHWSFHYNIERIQSTSWFARYIEVGS